MLLKNKKKYYNNHSNIIWELIFLLYEIKRKFLKKYVIYSVQIQTQLLSKTNEFIFWMLALKTRSL